MKNRSLLLKIASSLTVISGLLVTVYAAARLGRGPFAFSGTKILKIISGTCLALLGWIIGSAQKRKLFASYNRAILGQLSNLTQFGALGLQRLRRWGWQAGRRATKSLVDAFAETLFRRKPRLDPAVLILFALPFLLVILIPDWLYNPIASTDPWVYFGYFRHLQEFKGQLFPGAYYGSRLPFILPGYVANRLFGLIAARYVMYFSFFYLAVFSMYSLLKTAIGRRNALLIAVLFGVNSSFVTAIGCDYVDGAGITYNLFALALVACALKSKSPGPWLFLSGVAAAAMVYCNLVLIIFVPLFPAFYFFLKHDGTMWRSFRILLSSVVWCSAGAAFLSIVLGAINYKLDGNFWFYAPSIRVARVINFAIWRQPPRIWLHRAFWLGVPVTTVVGSIVFLLVRTWRKALQFGDYKLFFVLQLLASFSLMALWQFSGGIGLEISYYASYLLPSAFLALGCLLAVPMKRWNTWVYWSFLVAATLLFTTALLPAPSSIVGPVSRAGLLGMVVCCSAALLVKVVVPKSWYTLVVVLIAFWAFQVGIVPPFTRGPHPRDSFVRVVEGMNIVWPKMKTEPILFWYNQHETPFAAEYYDINAIYLGEARLMGYEFPKLFTAIRPTAGMKGVLISAQDTIVQQANEALRPLKLKVFVLQDNTIEKNHISYRLIFFQLAALESESIADITKNHQPAGIQFLQGPHQGKENNLAAKEFANYFATR